MYVTVKGNLAHDIRRVVDQEIERAGDVFVIGLVAARVVQRLREEAPELLVKFLDEHATQVISRMISDINRAERAQARTASNRSTFNEAVRQYEAGESKILAAWLDTAYVVTTGEQRKRLRDMDKDDLEYAAADYTERARTNAAQAAFLRALATKVGAKTVGEVFSDDELARMWNSLT